MAVSLLQVNNAIADTIRAGVTPTLADGLTESFDQLSDGIQDTPTIQVYPQHGDDHKSGSEVNRGSFGPAPVRVRPWVFHIDVMAQQRNIIAQNMTEVVRLASEIEDVLDQQNSKPLFGLEGIQDLTWYWDRVTIQYGDDLFAGLRFVCTVWVY